MEQSVLADGLDIEALYEFVTSLRSGNFSARLDVPESGRAREVALHLNRHMENMERTVSEITRVANEVGVEGKLGPQADVSLSHGPWRNMVEAVNALAGNVTDNVRDMQWTAGALVKNERFRKVHTNCQGEWIQLKSDINTLVDQLKASQAKPAPKS